MLNFTHKLQSFKVRLFYTLEDVNQIRMTEGEHIFIISP